MHICNRMYLVYDLRMCCVYGGYALFQKNRNTFLPRRKTHDPYERSLGKWVDNSRNRIPVLPDYVLTEFLDVFAIGWRQTVIKSNDRSIPIIFCICSRSLRASQIITKL